MPLLGWVAVGFFTSFVLSSFIRTSSSTSSSGSKSDFDPPTIDEGTTVPVVFGTRDITSTPLLWWGHLRITKVKSKTGKK